jgi:hypothetical protein
MQDFAQLMAAPFEVLRRWLHFDDASDLEKVGERAFPYWLSVWTSARISRRLCFHTHIPQGERFLGPRVSMKEQTYVDNWERDTGSEATGPSCIEGTSYASPIRLALAPTHPSPL